MNHSDKTNILGSWISVWNLDETCVKIAELARSSRPHYVCISNVHTVVTGHEDPSFAAITNRATLATADGVPLIWASRVLSGPRIHGRASGPDIFARMIADPRFSDCGHFFYGSTPQVLEPLRERLLTLNPKAKLAGFYSPPIRPAKNADDPLDTGELEDCRRIKESGANLVWIGLGAPKQEIWMARAKKHFKTGVLLGVGAAFDFISGNKSRAPLWMRKSGLEWAHRLLSEPRRLTGRYLKTNPIFVAQVLKQAALGTHDEAPS